MCSYFVSSGDRTAFRLNNIPVLRGPASGGPMSLFWILKRLVSVFINACRLLSALPSLSQFGQGRLSLVAISFYALSLLFGHVACRNLPWQGQSTTGVSSLAFGSKSVDNKKGFLLYCINTSQLGVSEITTHFCVEWFTHFSYIENT